MFLFCHMCLLLWKWCMLSMFVFPSLIKMNWRLVLWLEKIITFRCNSGSIVEVGWFAVRSTSSSLTGWWCSRRNQKEQPVVMAETWQWESPKNEIPPQTHLLCSLTDKARGENCCQNLYSCICVKISQKVLWPWIHVQGLL